MTAETPTDTFHSPSPSPISSPPSTLTPSPRLIHEPSSPSPCSSPFYSSSSFLSSHRCPVCGMATLISPLAVDRHLLNAHNVIDGTLVRFVKEEPADDNEEKEERQPQYSEIVEPDKQIGTLARPSSGAYVCPIMYCPLWNTAQFDRPSLLTHLTSAHGLDVIRFTTQDGVAWRWLENEDGNNDSDEEDRDNYSEDGIMFASSLLSSARTPSTDPTSSRALTESDRIQESVAQTTCPWCEQRFENSNIKHEHTISIHQGVDGSILSADEEGEYLCIVKDCGSRLKARGDIYRHLRRVHSFEVLTKRSTRNDGDGKKRNEESGGER